MSRALKLLVSLLVLAGIAPVGASAAYRAVALTTDSPQRIECWHSSAAYHHIPADGTPTTHYWFTVGDRPPGYTNCHPPNRIRVRSTVRLVTALGTTIPWTERTLTTTTPAGYPGLPAGHGNSHVIPYEPSAARVISHSRSRLGGGIRWKRPTEGCHRANKRKVLVCRLSEDL